jgi:arylsulfatase A-like enzyme
MQAVQTQNVVLILTDDQRFDTLQYMPNVQSLLVAHGLTFTNAFDNNPLCCPSRTTMMTGLTSGHSGVWWNENGPNGGYRAFVANGDQNRTTFGWLHDAGYRTGLVGKFLNGYPLAKRSWILPGVDDWQPFLLDKLGTTGCDPGGYWATCYSNNGVLEKRPSTDYSTTTSGDKAVGFISSAPADQPLYLYYAPRAPHLPTLPESAYASSCSAVPDISGPSYNTTIVNGPAYETSQAPWGPNKRATWQGRWHDDCRTLLSVDDQVGRIVQSLQDTGRLGNTLIMFVSDNGFLFGEHRWEGKLVPYEESTRVPLVIRDDAVIPAGSQGTATTKLVTNLDFAPTFLSAAGLTRTGLDGQSLFPLLSGGPGFSPETDILIEHQGGTQVPAYCGVRTPNWMYARYSTGEEELYHVSVDPYELTNVAANPTYATQLAKDKAAAEALCVPTPPGFAWG